MRKHVMSELGLVVVRNDNLGADNVDIETIWMEGDDPRYRNINSNVRNYLTEEASKAISELSKHLPTGMSVNIQFGLLPEHEKEILEGIDNVVLP